MSSLFSCCCCCCGSKEVKNKSNLKKGSALYKASLMAKTISGQTITQTVVKRLPSKADQQKLKNNPKTDPDMKLVLSEPFCLVDKITENLYLTGIGGLNEEKVSELRIRCVINATYEAPQLDIEGIQCIRVPVDDSVTDDIYPYLDEVSDIISEVTQHKDNVLVHCVAGISRSSTLVIAYLMKYQKMTLRNAFTFVKVKRNKSKPNSAFFEQLVKYEKKIFGNNSVKMVKLVRDRVEVTVPDFYEKDYPELLFIEIEANKFMQ